MTTMLCERCWQPIDRATEPLRLIPKRVPDLAGRQESLRLQAAVHARPCVEPDVGEWDPKRRGVAPAAVRWAAEQADDR